jgi:hypothetical protein
MAAVLVAIASLAAIQGDWITSVLVIFGAIIGVVFALAIPDRAGLRIDTAARWQDAEPWASAGRSVAGGDSRAWRLACGAARPTYAGSSP